MAEEQKKIVKKKVSAQVWKYYRTQENALVRVKKECPRCGKGVFLADHTDRYSCGKCGFTLFKKKEDVTT